MFFSANNGTQGVELWKSDGTATGTVLVKDISRYNSSPEYLTNVNGTLFFSASGELWKSDGTSPGTVLVKDINPRGTVGSNPSNLTNINGTLFFTADNGTQGRELWKSNGTTAGTVLVKDIYPGGSILASLSPTSLIDVNGTLFFTATNGTQGRELWKSNGTTAGTVLVKDIVPGSVGSNPVNLTNVNGTVYFGIRTTSGNYELWKSNGTVASTVKVYP